MRVGVLGAGLQGAGVALELASRSIDVDLYDRADRCLAGASLHNEGKIHLGYVYGNDPSLRTARLMVQGGRSFSPILRRWIGADLDRVPRSTPFLYLVHRESLLAVDQVGAYLGRVHELHREADRLGGADYFGYPLRQPPRRIANLEAAGINEARIAAAFETEEVAIDPEVLAGFVRARVAVDRGIRTLLNRKVDRVTRGSDGLLVTSSGGGEVRTERYDQVVNTLWDGRLQVDAGFGMTPERPWLFRYKEFARVQAAETRDLPTVTIVLGPFGDVVNLGGGAAYLSWYPVGLRAVTGALCPPRTESVLAGRDPAQVRSGIAGGLAAHVHGLQRLPRAAIDQSDLRGGWIFARGESDIDDPHSGLHERHRVGPRSVGGYHSVDTGKYTLAPHFALQVAERIAPRE